MQTDFVREVMRVIFDPFDGDNSELAESVELFCETVRGVRVAPFRNFLDFPNLVTT